MKATLKLTVTDGDDTLAVRELSMEHTDFALLEELLVDAIEYRLDPFLNNVFEEAEEEQNELLQKLAEAKRVADAKAASAAAKKKKTAPRKASTKKTPPKK